MPLYEYHCDVKGHRIEVIRRYEERGLCPCGCGARRIISAPAKTALRWGDTEWSGRYDRGLGTTIRDRRHREALMRQRGLRQLEDGEIDAQISSRQKEVDDHEDTMKSYNKHLGETGDAGLALARTFPCTEALS